jgi:YVTN family beta-propeller protein
LVIVTERLGNSISVIDTGKLEVRSSVPVCKEPTDAVIIADSSKAFVACSGANQVASVGLNIGPDQPEMLPEVNHNRLSETSRRLQTHSSQAGFGPDHLLALLDVGKTPVHLALKPDGGEVFVSNFGSDSISEIATATNEVEASYVIGAGPVRATISADGSVLYISNFNSDTVGIYSIDDGKLIGTVHVGNRPDALALSPNQNFLFVADTAAGDVSVVRTAAKNGAVLLTIIPVGQQPNAIAVKAFVLRKPPSAAEQRAAHNQ